MPVSSVTKVTEAAFFVILIDSHFSGTFMVITSPGDILCNVNTKFYAKESRGGHSADFSLASPPLLAEMNLTKKAEQ